jgi:uncharacterized protein
MWVKVHSSSRKVVAICDEDIIGKSFEEGIRILDVRESFYKGERMEKKEVLELMKREFADGSTFNIVGRESVNVAIEAKIIGKGDSMKVKRIPFVIIVN